MNDPTASGYYTMGLYIAAAVASLVTPFLGKYVTTKVSMTVAYGISCIIFAIMIIFVK